MHFSLLIEIDQNSKTQHDRIECNYGMYTVNSNTTKTGHGSVVASAFDFKDDKDEHQWFEA